ncbi:predicted protein [Sclerotinia sclerotiorum 1980 UF-70]|uniref:Uncharacterized protein n=1 Tax=Sclerotinia sclerotiorum (strain ATCC 18683 / 1980 / Ss-1) TaxID=665079 RepID=A7EJ05_SCLS1|nr:predicted protein [Sclerotinia sclerotiorum 1980 UF-70]EDO02821.1 predicted protein [Sclerotinia sclerotiorum 1980 UF-70]
MASTEPIALEPALAGQQTLPPIPLRTLVTLINYQCSVNSERYSARSLYDREAFRRASLRRNTFHYDSSLQQSPYLPATCSVHPNRKAGADDLSSAQLERNGEKSPKTVLLLPPRYTSVGPRWINREVPVS